MQFEGPPRAHLKSNVREKNNNKEVPTLRFVTPLGPPALRRQPAEKAADGPSWSAELAS